jgi:succinate-semialdehyde dehydrogenase/glutarate-semialdehyde dehydrogenase
MINSGQSCIAAKRFILHESIADEFERKFIDRMWNLRVGEPLDPKTELGPLASEELLLRLHQQVMRSKELGAEIVTGGTRLERPGFYYAPTVLKNIPQESPAYKEELFGPVASVFRARDAESAIEIANDTEFGLGSSVWTHDPHEQQLFARELESGSVFLNQKVVSDPRLPFGGVKKSGYGRELSAYGIHEFVNIKTVWVSPGEPVQPVPGQPDSGELE